MATSLSLPRAGQGTPHLSLFFPFSPAHLPHAEEPACAGVQGDPSPDLNGRGTGSHGTAPQASCPQSS